MIEVFTVSSHLKARNADVRWDGCVAANDMAAGSTQCSGGVTNLQLGMFTEISRPGVMQVTAVGEDDLVNPNHGNDVALQGDPDRNSEVALVGTKELSVAVEPEGLLVCGDRDIVAGYLERIKDVAGSGVRVAGIDKKSLADLAAVGASIGALTAQTGGDLVRLSPASMELLKNFNIVPGTEGFNRMTVMGADHLFKGQLQWQAIAMTPQAAMTVQLAVVAAALRTAIASVEAAVDRVQGSVDQILALAASSVTGDVIGHHEALANVCKTLDETGVLPTADWQSVAGLGPVLSAGVEKLRNHIKKTLEGFDSSRPIQDRATHLTKAVNDNRLGESLQLLIVAEDSLYLWQRLRIERVRGTEPEHLDTVVKSAREILADHLGRDQELIEHLHTELDAYGKTKPLEIMRWMSSSQMKKDMVHLRQDVDGFAEARRGQVLDWMNHQDPTIGDAYDEVGGRIASAGKAVGHATAALGSRSVDWGAGILGQVGGKLVNVASSRLTVDTSGAASTTSDESAPEPRE